MISFLIGAPKSGKSLWAESLLSQAGRPLIYVGTLPNTPEFRETIKAHRARRGREWLLIELTGDIQRDSKHLRHSLDDVHTILLDGLSFYLLRSHAAFGAHAVRDLRASARLLDLATKTSSHLFIVDSPLAMHLTGVERNILGCVHRAIIMRAAHLWKFDQGEAASIDRLSALGISSQQPTHAPGLLPPSASTSLGNL